MDIGLFGAAYSGLKFAKDALQLSLDLRVDSESRVQVHAALEKLGVVQDSLFELREELFRLQAENEQLRRDQKISEDWASATADYNLATTVGGAIVYEFVGCPHHYACPSCFSKRAIQILQDCHVMSGKFECPACKAGYPVKQRERW